MFITIINSFEPLWTSVCSLSDCDHQQDGGGVGVTDASVVSWNMTSVFHESFGLGKPSKKQDQKSIDAIEGNLKILHRLSIF